MTVVTRKLRVLAPALRHLLEGRIHHVTSNTEVVGVLGVIPCCRTCSGYGEDENDTCRSKRDLRSARARRQPSSNLLPPSDEIQDDRNADNDSEDETDDLDPRWHGSEKKSNDSGHAAGQRRCDSD